jgi:alpha-beta hydrolase superfamily lysophospholipase
VGSPLASDRVPSWVDATSSAAGWLREQSGCDRLVVVGIGLGGLIAYQAVAAGAEIDDLVLWGTRPSGRAHVRELRAFAAAMAEEVDAKVPETPDDGVIDVGGHAMSSATAEALSAIKLADTPLPSAQLRRVLLVGRDAHGIDQALRRHLEGAGARVTAMDADDYHCLVARPELQLVPTKTISASIDWMRDGASADLDPIGHGHTIGSTKTVSSVAFEHDGTRIRESIVELPTAAGRLIGIISEPVNTAAAPYCLVAVNAGALRHTGPSRMFVEIARAAAASGVPAARFDLPGLGDSDGSASKTFERTAKDDVDSLAALALIYDHLQQLGVADRFVPTGLCTGGYLALLMVPQDARSIGAIALNPPTLSWGEAQRKALLRGVAANFGPNAAGAERHLDRTLNPLQRGFDRLGRRRYVVEAHARRRLAQVDLLWRNAYRAQVSSATEIVDRLGGTGAPLFIQLSENETLRRTFAQPKVAARLQRWPNIRIKLLATRDHDLRPRWIQEIVFDQVSSALEEFRTLAEAQAGLTDATPGTATDQSLPTTADLG